MNDMNQAIIDAFLLVVELREMFTGEASALRADKQVTKATSNVMLYRTATGDGCYAATIGAGLNISFIEPKSENYLCLSVDLSLHEEVWCLDSRIEDQDENPLRGAKRRCFSNLGRSKGEILKAVENDIIEVRKIVRTGAT
jgi:hypothetical protein